MTTAITDADRELFIDLFTPGWKHPESSHRWEVTSGGMDDDPRMQALAAHRIQARKEAIEEAARYTEDGFRCRSCRATFIGEMGHPDNGCERPNWDYLPPEQAAAAIRALGEGVE